MVLVPVVARAVGPRPERQQQPLIPQQQLFLPVEPEVSHPLAALSDAHVGAGVHVRETRGQVLADDPADVEVVVLFLDPCRRRGDEPAGPVGVDEVEVVVGVEVVAVGQERRPGLAGLDHRHELQLRREVQRVLLTEPVHATVADQAQVMALGVVQLVGRPRSAEVAPHVFIVDHERGGLQRVALDEIDG